MQDPSTSKYYVYNCQANQSPTMPQLAFSWDPFVVFDEDCVAYGGRQWLWWVNANKPPAPLVVSSTPCPLVG